MDFSSRKLGTTYVTACMGAGDKKNCQISHASVFFHVPNIHVIFLPVNGRCWSETTSRLQHLFCHANDYYSSPLYHHLSISCEATSITSLSLAIRYVTWYWQPAATHSFWAAYNFWQSGQLTFAVIPILPCHQEKNFQGFFVFLSTKQFEQNPDSKFR